MPHIAVQTLPAEEPERKKEANVQQTLLSKTLPSIMFRHALAFQTTSSS